jgi:pantoate--beta-alanine ligase
VLEVVSTLAQWRGLTESLRAEGRSVGLTMTMGALHAGHTALLERAARECDASLASIFVNPLQFNDPSDLERYPVDLEADLGVCERSGVRAVLAPPVAEVWPDWPAPTPTVVHVTGLTEVFEGAHRPGHFDGVAGVVAKVAIATGECRGYFGEKDFQQLSVVRQLVGDLGIPMTVVACETVREADGLALSSRNVRLTDTGRAAALSLSRALRAGRDAIERGDGVLAAHAAMARVAAEEPEVELAYAAAVEPATLRVPASLAPGAVVRLLIAGTVEGIRLIDNVEAVAGAAP